MNIGLDGDAKLPHDCVNKSCDSQVTVCISASRPVTAGIDSTSLLELDWE